MQKLGYSESEISKIQSQMCMLPFATDKLKGKQKSTCISFKDIEDDEVYENVTQEEEDKVDKSKLGETLFEYSSNELEYLVKDDGDHSLKNYTEKGVAMPACISSVVSKALENSINNFYGEDEFKPITAKEITEDIPKIIKGALKGKNKEELMNYVDKKIDYKGARKLSDNEVNLLDQIDESYSERIKLNDKIKSMEATLKEARENQKMIEEVIKENCTENTYLKIKLKSGYQFDKEKQEEILNSPSDKELIEGKGQMQLHREEEKLNLSNDRESSKEKKQTQLQQKEAQLSALESEEKRISKAEALIDKQNYKDIRD